LQGQLALREPLGAWQTLIFEAPGAIIAISAGGPGVSV
jgi:hypothetical protein